MLAWLADLEEDRTDVSLVVLEDSWWQVKGKRQMRKAKGKGHDRIVNYDELRRSPPAALRRGVVKVYSFPSGKSSRWIIVGLDFGLLLGTSNAWEFTVQFRDREWGVQASSHLLQESDCVDTDWRE